MLGFDRYVDKTALLNINQAYMLRNFDMTLTFIFAGTDTLIIFNFALIVRHFLFIYGFNFDRPHRHVGRFFKFVLIVTFLFIDGFNSYLNKTTLMTKPP